MSNCIIPVVGRVCWVVYMDAELSLKANIAWNSFGSLLYSGCQWLTTVLVVRLTTGYDAAGILALAMAVSNVFAPIALYKIRSYQVSDIHELTSSGEYVAFRFVTIGLAAILTVGYMLLTCSAESYMAIMLYSAFRFVDLFIDVLHGIDQQHARMDYCGKSMAARSVLFTIAFCVALLFTNNLEFAIGSMLVATLPVVFYDLKCAGSLSSVKPVFSLPKTRELLLECFPAVMGTVACSLVVTVARQYLGYKYGDAALGIYATVCTPIVLIQACSSYVYAPLLGMFASKLDRGDKASFVALFVKVLVAFAVIFVIGGILFFFMGDVFLRVVFGEEIAKNGHLMYAGLASSACAACIAFVTDLLIAMRDMRGTLIANVASCVVSLPLTFLLVDACGMNGVSLSIALSYGMGVAISCAHIMRRLRTA